MTTMKKRSICGLMAAMLLLTTACGGSKESSTEQKDAPQTEGAEAELTEWEKSSGIFNTDETEEELYELAKQEGSVIDSLRESLFSFHRPFRHDKN